MKKFTVPDNFVVGEIYTNDQIHYALEIGNFGGVRPKLDADGNLKLIVITTSTEQNKNTIKNPYADSIEDGILTYTGAGLVGEQGVTGVNKRIIEQADKPIPIIGFIKKATNQYTYIGFLYLLRHYTDFQLDSLGSMRKVVIFEFQIIPELEKISIDKISEQFLPIYNSFNSKIKIEDRVIDQPTPTNEIIDETSNIMKVEMLKNRLITVNPYEFEVIISNLITHVGFSDVQVTKKSGDGGVDINAILKNLASVDLKYAFQVKRWKHSVGRNEVANLRGSMGFNNQGVIITTSHFTASAKNESQAESKTPINLVGISTLQKIIEQTNFNIDHYLDT